MAQVVGGIGLGFCTHVLEIKDKKINFYECFIKDVMGYCIEIGEIDSAGSLYLMYIPEHSLVSANYNKELFILEFKGVVGSTSIFSSLDDLSDVVTKFKIYVDIKYSSHAEKSALFLVSESKRHFCKVF